MFLVGASVHFVNTNCTGFQPPNNGMCLCSTGVVVKQTNSIVLATFDSLKFYARDQQCCIFRT